MTLGKKLRTERLFDKDSGKFLEILVDHHIGRGLQEGLIRIEEKLDAIAAGLPKAITMQKGIANRFFEKYAGMGISLILKCSSASPYTPTQPSWFADVEEAVSMGADGIATGGIFGSINQPMEMERIGQLTKEAARFGMPVIGHIYPHGELIEKKMWEDWTNVAYAARAGAELGIDILKIHHNGTPDSFARIIEAVPAPVVLAGGKVSDDIRGYLEMARRALDAGAAGLAFGRVVWNHPNVALFIQALKFLVFKGGTVEETMELLEELERKNRREHV